MTNLSLPLIKYYEFNGTFGKDRYTQNLTLILLAWDNYNPIYVPINKFKITRKSKYGIGLSGIEISGVV